MGSRWCVLVVHAAILDHIAAGSCPQSRRSWTDPTPLSCATSPSRPGRVRRLHPVGSAHDEEALDRIIRRAQELDAGRSPDGVVDDDALLAAAEEVGISADAMRQAMAIERIGPAPSRQRTDRLVGPRRVVVERTLARPAEEVLDRLDEWLTSGHHLRRVERLDDGGVWRKRSDVAASAQRAVKSLTGAASLGTVHLIEARVVAAGDGVALMRIEADRSGARSATLGAAGGIGGASLAGGAAAATMVPPLAVVAVPGLFVAGLVGRHGRRTADRLDVELTRLLAQLSAGERPTTIGRRSRR